MRKILGLLGLTLAVALTTAALTSPAAAQSAADVKTCGDKSNLDRLIAACTRIVSLGTRVALNTRTYAYNNRAFGYHHKGDQDNALRDADEAIRLNPNIATLYSVRGQIYLAKRDYDRAIRNFDDALRLSPKSALLYANRGSAYLQNGDYDRAIKDLDEALRLDPKDAQSYSDRGVAYDRKGDPDRALRDFNESIRYDPRNARALINRGSTYLDKGELDRALADLNEAVRLDAKLAPAYGYRGRVFEAKGDIERARADLRRAIELDSTLTKARERLARLDAAANPPAPTIQTATTSVSTAAATTAPAHTSPAPALTEKRVALVIGNGAYANVPALANPLNDARTVADALRSVGFSSVRSATNVKRDALVNELKAFAAEAEGADWAVVYFAGHGIEIGGVNWLIPVDAALKADRDVQFEAVAIEQVLGAVESAKKLALVVLDACRDNPFAAQMRSTTATRSIGRGLAAIEPRRGTLVAFAAKHGQVALDGTSANSPFVSSLVRHIQTPGVEINKVFRLVRDDVLNATNARQEPFIYGTLPAQDFFFASR